MSLEIVTSRDILRRPCKEVTPDQLQDPEFQEFIERMVREVLERGLLGLSANQVRSNIGSNRRLYVGYTDKGNLGAVINPRILSYSPEVAKCIETCASFPDQSEPVWRSKIISLESSDRNGKKSVREMCDPFGNIAQHEVDHLKGILPKDKGWYKDGRL